MARISVDLTGVEVGGRRFPVGSFRVEIVKSEYGVAKSSGKPKITVTFASRHEGVFAQQWANYSLQKQSRFALKRLLLATGEWSAADLQGPLEFDTEDLVGLTLGIVVGPSDDGNGNPSTDIISEILEEEATGPAPEATSVSELQTGDPKAVNSGAKDGAGDQDFSKLF